MRLLDVVRRYKMKHKIIEVESLDGIQSHVIVDRGDGSFESFPVNEDNPRYQQWLDEGNEPELIENGVE